MGGGDNLWGIGDVKWAPRQQNWWESIPDALNAAGDSISKYRRAAAMGDAEAAKTAQAQQQINIAQQQANQTGTFQKGELDLRNMGALDAMQRAKAQQAISQQNANTHSDQESATQEQKQGAAWAAPIQNEMDAIKPLDKFSAMAPLSTIYGDAQASMKRNPESMYYLKPEQVQQFPEDIQSALTHRQPMQNTALADAFNRGAGQNVPAGAQMYGAYPEQLTRDLSGVKEARMAAANAEMERLKATSNTGSLSFDQRVQLKEQDAYNRARYGQATAGARDLSDAAIPGEIGQKIQGGIDAQKAELGGRAGEIGPHLPSSIRPPAAAPKALTRVINGKTYTWNGKAWE